MRLTGFSGVGSASLVGFSCPGLELVWGYRTQAARDGEGLTAEPREEAALDDCALDDWRDHRAPRESNGRSSKKHGGTVGMEEGGVFGWMS